MAKHINNMDELEKALLPHMTKMVDTMATKVYETLNYFLQEYYSSYTPKSYRRQKDFLRSAVKVEPKSVRGKVIASVYIDYESKDILKIQQDKWVYKALSILARSICHAIFNVKVAKQFF